jgi:hypothetical protein
MALGTPLPKFIPERVPLFIAKFLVRDYAADLAAALKNGFGNLFTRAKSLRVSILGAESSHQPHVSMTFPEKKPNFPRFLAYHPVCDQILPGGAT